MLLYIKVYKFENVNCNKIDSFKIDYFDISTAKILFFCSFKAKFQFIIKLFHILILYFFQLLLSFTKYKDDN